MEKRTAAQDGFTRTRETLEKMVGFLESDDADTLTHGELEERIGAEGRELLRQLLQDHLDLRAGREVRLSEVKDHNAVPRRAAEAGHVRALETVFGEVAVSRIAYRRRQHTNLFPSDSVLNLPDERHSHGLRRLAALEATRGSFEGAVRAVERATGQLLAKRQLGGLALRAAGDFDSFYKARLPPESEPDDVLVLSADGKGIVMRKDALREATRKAAESSSSKLATRLSKGEKRDRKRMATVGAVYDAKPAPRIPADVLARTGEEQSPGPVAKNKWLVASVAEDAASVVRRLFDEAERRDPLHARAWVCLVDGNNHQIDRVEHEAKARGVTVPIVIDFIHVLEYIWSAAWSFFSEGDTAAEAWVGEKAYAVLAGDSSLVAASIRRKATTLGLDASARANADTCADYLINKRRYLDYPTALGRGWPVGTGVIEGACRHIVRDRMAITGARWGLDGAEAILKLRALISNGDFDEYWRHHLAHERQRVHDARYADNIIPLAA
jgi:hypothetical protein